jgi:glycosyltransferase involved in cell wall biosynthesis
MRVLYFHQHFNTPKGTVGVRSYKMARALIAGGHQVTMVCGSYVGGSTGLTAPFRKGRREGNVEGIRVIELELPYSNADGFLKRTIAFLKFSLRSARIAVTEPADIVFATSTPLTAAIPGMAARHLRGRQFVFEVRDLWPELPKAMGVIANPIVLGLLRMLEWAGYRSAHRTVALADGIADGIAARGVSRERIATIPNGCDLDLFGQGAAAFNHPAIGAGDLVALYTGTHGQANGLDAVLDAAAELRRRGRGDIRFLMVGTGSVKSRLAARVADEALDNVLMLEPVPKTELAAIMARADVGMQILANVPAFYRGTSPNKFFDYLAAGRPVLINYPGWVAELVRANACGFVVPPDDAAAFADALEAAADDRAALAPMGVNSRALAEREFDRDKLAGKFVPWVVHGQHG